ncbi:MAG: hypothetical protein DRQ78_00160 [Epsilonproteobacteria bacterium]|nr:MAG: hypothetical protein DRQ78_00160 [Campylobacterota bacterium]
MKEFLEERGSYLLGRKINLASDNYHSKDRIVAIFDMLKTRSVSIEESVDFLIDSIESIEQASENVVKTLNDKISHLTTSIIHIGKLKLSYPSTATEGNIKLVDLTDGTYDGIAYSSTDSGLIMDTTIKTKLREK